MRSLVYTAPHSVAMEDRPLRWRESAARIFRDFWGIAGGVLRRWCWGMSLSGAMPMAAGLL